MSPEIGIRFEYDNREGVILQSCSNLPKHYNRESEQGPFYGVSYEKEYVWYNDEGIKKLLMKAVIKSSYNSG